MSAERNPISRREFLAGSAATGAALVVGFHFGGCLLAQGVAERTAPSPFDAWIRIDTEGKVTLILAKSEMGQGVMTSLPMILAEELEVDWRQVRVEQAPTNPTIYRHGTGGSASVRTSYLPLRQAGAAARQMLVAAAAARWGVEAAACRTEAGAVLGPAAARASYGELAAEAAKLPVPDLAQVRIKNVQSFRLVGTSPPRAEIPAKVAGSARFGLDMRVPGMLFAAIARCPVYGGRPKRFDAARARAVRGVREVIEIPAVGPVAFTRGGIAVVAENSWAALSGRDALAIEWEFGPHAGESSASLRRQFEELVAREGTVVRDDGDARAALAGAAKKLEAVYEVPFQIHAPMEPLNATADVREGKAELWVASQAPDWVQNSVAQLLAVPPAQVVVHTTLLGGGFGRRFVPDPAVEAAQVSRAVGKPVQVVWSREDDLRHGFYRPAALHRLVAALDGEGRPLAWQHKMTSTSIRSFWSRPGQGNPEESEIGGAVNLPYALPAIRMEYAPAKTGLPVMWWRSVEHSGNAFVVESFFDEVAAAAGVDPLEFRLRYLAEPRKLHIPAGSDEELETERLKRVLKLAAEKAGWGKPLPAGRGRGIAAHWSFQSYVAHVAEVSVEGGRVRVHRVVSAVDCGRVIHPDNARAQIEGGIAFGLTAALKSAITLAEGRVEQGNFDDYEMLRIDEMPQVEVHFVESDAAPTGLGEPGVPPIAPAVANAVFAATGKRVRRLPIRPQDLA